MPVNSISSGQPVQVSQTSKIAETVAARKQSDIRDSDKVKDREAAAESKAQLQKTQESNKPVVNTSGQQTGSRINVTA